MRKSKSVFGFAAAFFCLMLFVLGTHQTLGQAQTGTLRGTVTDPNGGVVAGATVTEKNQATGVVSSSFTTTSEGTFQIANLVPGKYTVTIEQKGFSKKAVTDVDVRLGTVVDISVPLAVGTPTETVTVTS